MYNYVEEVKKDCINEIREDAAWQGVSVAEFLQKKDEQDLHDEYFVRDAVTGNASGSYYCNAYKAEEAIAHNWDLINDVQAEFGELDFSKGAEYIDVSIRCYVLGEALSEAINELAGEEE